MLNTVLLLGVVGLTWAVMVLRGRLDLIASDLYAGADLADQRYQYLRRKILRIEARNKS